MGDRGRTGHRRGRRLRAVRRQLLAVGGKSYLRGVIGRRRRRRRAGLIGGMMIGLAGAVRVHLTRATVTRIVGVVRVILRTVSGELGGILRQVLRRRVLRRERAGRGGRQRLIAQVGRGVVGARRHYLARGRARHLSAGDLRSVTGRRTVLRWGLLSRARARTLAVRRGRRILIVRTRLLGGLLDGIAVLLVRLTVIARGLHLSLIVQRIRAYRRLADRQWAAAIAHLISTRLNLRRTDFEIARLWKILYFCWKRFWFKIFVLNIQHVHM